MNEILETSYYNNTLYDYLIAATILIIGVSLVRVIKSVILRRIKNLAEKSETNIDDYVVRGIEKFIIPILYFVAIYIAIHYLTLSTKSQNVLHVATTVVITYFIVRLFSTTILLLLQNYVKKQERGEEKVKQLGGLMLIVNFVIWAIGLLFLFDNMGYDVTAIVTGLGVGGIAVALAAQNILGDLFNYFVIFFDRPFEIGDFIIIDDKMGVVDNIGIKTTRFKSLTGEQLVIPNSHLTGSRIHNYKRMERRRIVFNIGVVYETSLDNIKKIPNILRTAIEASNGAQFDRAHFISYKDYSLNFEAVYFVLSSEYIKYADIQQAINIYLFEEFKKLGIEFAYPTQSLYLKNVHPSKLGLEDRSVIKGEGNNSLN